MSDALVVALVPGTGRPGFDTELSALVSRVVAVSTDMADRAVDVVADPHVAVVLCHDPALGSVATVERVVEHVLATGRPVVPVLPCSDTVKRLDDADVVIDTPDRDELRVLRSPIGYPAGLVRSGTVRVGTVPVGALTITVDGG
jgi:2-C-methyl-D-erythritol 4-phosphate cytidylyltransferase